MKMSGEIYIYIYIYTYLVGLIEALHQTPNDPSETIIRCLQCISYKYVTYTDYYCNKIQCNECLSLNVFNCEHRVFCRLCVRAASHGYIV